MLALVCFLPNFYIALDSRKFVINVVAPYSFRRIYKD